MFDYASPFYISSLNLGSFLASYIVLAIIPKVCSCWAHYFVNILLPGSTFKDNKADKNFLWSPITTQLPINGNCYLTTFSIRTGATF